MRTSCRFLNFGRCLQLSIRTLLAAVTGLCVFLAYVAEGARSQRRAVESLRTANATVLYEYDDSNGVRFQSLGPNGSVSYRRDSCGRDVPAPIPKTLREIFGDDMFFRATCVIVDNDAGTDVDSINQVRSIAQALRHMRHLVDLCLVRVPVTDEDVASIRAMRHLRALNLSGTAVTDRAVTEMRCLASLQVLRLSSTAVSDDGMEQLCTMTSLEELYLSDTNLSDDGLLALRRLKNLRFLAVLGTKVTHEGVHEFKKALPMCQVLH